MICYLAAFLVHPSDLLKRWSVRRPSSPSPARDRSAARIALALPVIVLLLAATAVPIELRSLGTAKPTFSLDDPLDIASNIIGYLPLGIVLGGLGPLRAIIVAGLISTFAEAGQLVMMHRDPSFTDVLSNVVGAALGAFATVRWAIRPPALRLSRRNGLIAVALAVAAVVYVRAAPGSVPSTRGALSPGVLEADWKLDEGGGRAVLDSSGHELIGKFRKDPTRTPGAVGSAVVLDGTNYADFGRPMALRLAGSMTISAWIKSSAYPYDDAVILSRRHRDQGYQLDTTIDRGPRTIGFKLADACGELMARYGATPLALETWYHVAGVFDAPAKTLSVYLNGALDDGFLLGAVTNAQRTSRGAIYLGSVGSTPNFNFTGSIGRVRIYSFALTKPQIAADMRGEVVGAPPFRPYPIGAPCAQASDPEDKEIPGAAAALGALVAVACLGARPSAPRWLVLGIGAGAGVILASITPFDLPAFNHWTLPLVALAGAASVVLSVRGDEH